MMKETLGRLSQQLFTYIQPIKYTFFYTLKELIRDKVVWLTLGLALLLVVFGFLVSSLSFIDPASLLLSIGSTSASLISIFASLVLGSVVIARDIETKLIYTIFVRPISRLQWALGRLFGINAIIALNTFVILFVSLVLTLILGRSFTVLLCVNLLVMMASIILQSLIILFIALCFSLISNAIFSIATTSGLVIIGYAIDDLALVAQKIEPHFLRPILRFLSMVLIDFASFDFKPYLMHSVAIVPTAALYLIVYTLLCVCLGAIIAKKLLEGKQL